MARDFAESISVAGLLVAICAVLALAARAIH